MIIKPDPKLDLVLERVVDVPRELVWECWTKAVHIPHWFVPRLSTPERKSIGAPERRCIGDDAGRFCEGRPGLAYPCSA